MEMPGKGALPPRRPPGYFRKGEEEWAPVLIGVRRFTLNPDWTIAGIAVQAGKPLAAKGERSPGRGAISGLPRNTMGELFRES